MGASIGVKGARLTVTPRGTTYITVGSQGFYYRETISTGVDRNKNRLSLPPPLASESITSDEIRTAEVADLVDSSSETLVRQLNERAKIFNPAWILYAAVPVAMLIGIVMLQYHPSNAADPGLNLSQSYDSLVGHYGYPDTVLASSPLSIVPVRKASYAAANVSITFVPELCTKVYQKVTEVLRDQQPFPILAKEQMRKLHPCMAQPNATWVAVEYVTLDEDSRASESNAKRRLNELIRRRDNPPVINSDKTNATKKVTISSRASKQQNPIKQVWSAAADVIAQIRTEKEREVAAHRRQASRGYVLIIGSIGIFVAGVVVHKKNTEKRTSRLFYELNESESEKHSVIQQAVNHLSHAHQVWRIQADSPTWDWKRNAGASNLVRRVSIRVGYGNPPRVESNVKVPSIAMGHATLYFMPDLILYSENGKFGAISYSDFQVQQGSTRFIEDGFVPSDATHVGRTWRYVRVDGGPDRRFNNNVQLPVLQYGTLAFQSSRGLNIHLQISSAEASAAFANCWRELHSRKPRIEGERTGADNKDSFELGPEAAGRKILGVSDSATPDEISAAYRRLAQLYHPDKVAGLAPEFQVLADKRMKEINAAYELLKRHNTQTA